MEILESFNALLGQGAALIVITGFSAWVGSIWKERIILREKSRYDLRVEQIKSEYSLRTRNLENELQVERNLVQLGQTKLVEKRAAFIDETYRLLVDLHESIYKTIRPDYFGRPRPTMEIAYELALPKFDALVEGYEKNKIYFSKATSGKIADFYVSAAQALDQARVAMRSGEILGRGETPQLQSLFERVNYKMHEARTAVEDEFRQLMHVE